MSDSAYFQQFIGLDDIEEMAEFLRPMFQGHKFEVKRYEGWAHGDSDDLWTLNFWIHKTGEFDALEKRLEEYFYIMDWDFGHYFIVRRKPTR